MACGGAFHSHVEKQVVDRRGRRPDAEETLKLDCRVGVVRGLRTLGSLLHCSASGHRHYLWRRIPDWGRRFRRRFGRCCGSRDFDWPRLLGLGAQFGELGLDFAYLRGLPDGAFRDDWSWRRLDWSVCRNRDVGLRLLNRDLGDGFLDSLSCERGVHGRGHSPKESKS